jgi:hypothetical protein
MQYVQDLIKEINNLRKNPVSFADKILSYKRYFKEEKVIKLPGEKFGIQLEEGFPAYKEAAQYLNSLTPVGEMTASKGLIRIAKDYLEKCKDCDPEEIGNIEISPIIEKYGSFKHEFHNAMDFGSNTPELVVVNLLVSDGDPSRANRDILLDPYLKRIGIALGKHKEYGPLTVIIACTEFNNKVDKNDYVDFGGSADVQKNEIKKDIKPENKKDKKPDIKKNAPEKPVGVFKDKNQERPTSSSKDRNREKRTDSFKDRNPEKRTGSVNQRNPEKLKGSFREKKPGKTHKFIKR